MLRRFALAFFLVMVAITGCGAPGDPNDESQTVAVAAAADLKFALDEIINAFEAEHDGWQISVSYGSSGNFVQQIRNGAPFDVYLSADITLAEALADSGFADPADVFGYATGRLVVWAADGSPADPTAGVSGLVRDDVKTVAIANPQHAPYGQAAEAAMRTAGVLEELKGKLVLGENIAQAAEFAQTGNADAGIIALALALSPGLSELGTFSEVPLDDFPRLNQGGVVLSRASESAHIFADFLTSPAGQEILSRYGFSPPDGEG
ncbi:molybdate ABC transporter substrate-binding protein [Hoyosella altamirensis]|uniref:Molybdate transport system substrate-binding protein n=1 Tax=Hoyosella altamirensis TaxID=616997 RepID=A0A839RJE6_9ACTN|nr:molybdate ABC transporter substrate-binding protein [Hoyosella altamirensis]MBB3036952.1 molybdate transport system substrate-binding protein [Hoyosella altamirensis]